MRAPGDIAGQNGNGRAQSREGFVLLSTAVAMVGVIGLLGLAVDVGRMYVVKSELQTYADNAALAATWALDGTSQGITNASRSIQNVAGNPFASNRWNFATQAVANAQIGFSTSAGGPFVSNPASAKNVMFAQVTVSETVPMYFLPVLPAIGTTATVHATSTAGQIARTSLGDGLSPFSPDAHSLTDPNFGFTLGQQYTLRWPPSGQKAASCAGDVGYSPAGSSDRGYVDVGQGTGNSGLTSAIVDNNYALSYPITVGSSLSMVSGQKGVESTMQIRFNQDTDTTSINYSTYTGNGRRVLIVPINNGSDPAQVVGFGAFFLPVNACGSKNVSPCCAQYIGPALEFSNHPGAASGGGVYQVELVH